jgi:hypothetical protein
MFFEKFSCSKYEGSHWINLPTTVKSSIIWTPGKRRFGTKSTNNHPFLGAAIYHTAERITKEKLKKKHEQKFK